MKTPLWKSVVSALRDINRDTEHVSFDDLLLFGIQGFLRIHLLIETGGKFYTWRRNEGNYLATDVEYDRCWSTLPVAESGTLKLLRLEETAEIGSILVRGQWGDQEVQTICFERPKTINRSHLILWHEEYDKLRAIYHPEKPLHASERHSLLAIIRLLAELHGVKPKPTRGDGDGWHKAVEALLAECAGKFDPRIDPTTLKKHLRSAFKSKA